MAFVAQRHHSSRYFKLRCSVIVHGELVRTILDVNNGIRGSRRSLEYLVMLKKTIKALK
jgi:hypothetical protein